MMPESTLKELERTDDGVIMRFADGNESTVDYAALRLHCPCAKCKPSWQNEQGRHELAGEIARMPDQRPQVELVGRYGLRFIWQSGCSMGIYSGAHLRSIADGTLY